jgi:hypothetical protein
MVLSSSPAFQSSGQAQEGNIMSKRPVSEAKLAANRANAKRSTGPKSADGKSHSAANAVTHGLLAE